MIKYTKAIINPLNLLLKITLLTTITISNLAIAVEKNIYKLNAISYGYNSTENEKFYLGEPDSKLTGCKKIINLESRFARCKKMTLLTTYTGHFDYFACNEKNSDDEYLLFNKLEACQADLVAMKQNHRKDLTGKFGFTASSNNECVVITPMITKSFRKCGSSKPLTIEADKGITHHICRTEENMPYIIFDDKNSCEAIKNNCSKTFSKYSCYTITYVLGE